MAITIGIDIGTSGCRACAIDDDQNILSTCCRDLASAIINGNAIEQDAELWWQAVAQLLNDLCQQIDCQQVAAIAIDGTSGTLLVTDNHGTPLGPAMMYNDSRAIEQARRIQQHAPESSAVHGPSSGLAKLLYLLEKHPETKHALHQADWIAGHLSGDFTVTDANNALKTGFNPLEDCWPDWLDRLDINRDVLPRVVTPGTVTGTISKAMSQRFNLPVDTKIVAGTTDSIAAFIATGASQPGEAVTSLGSTLVLKIISDTPIFNSNYGIYSHKLGKHWLAGGASNSGGAVLKQFFSSEQLHRMTPLLKPEKITGLDYYPLTQAGERFPDNNPLLPPVLEPRPDDDVTFFRAYSKASAK